MASKDAQNLKVNVGADTSQFTRGMKAAKDDLKSFGQASRQGMGEFSRAIGVSNSGLNNAMSVLRNFGTAASAAGKGGASAFSSILSGVNAVKFGIAGLGIAALAATFKSMKEDAEQWKKTIEGARFDKSMTAYMDVYKQTFQDALYGGMNDGFLQGIFSIEQEWNKFTTRAGARWKALGISVVESFNNRNAINRLLGFGGLLAFNQMAVSAASNQADTNAPIASEAATKIYDAQRKLSDLSIVLAKADAEIAELMKQATDESFTYEERLAFLDSALQKVKEKAEKQLPLERQIADEMKRYNDLASSTPEQIDAANQQMVKVFGLEQAQSQIEKTILRQRQRITKQAEQQAAADTKAAKELREQEAAAKRLADSKKALAAFNSELGAKMSEASSLMPGNQVSTTQQATLQVKPVVAPPAWVEFVNDLDKALISIGENHKFIIGFDYDVKGLVDFSNTVQDTISDLVSSLSTSIGALFADLANGDNAWANFGQAAVSAFADMAITVGKIAIATGVAATGIKAALELNPYLAIAAGAALVALGAAAKTALSNVASGNYSASTSVATSSSYSSANSAAGRVETSDIQVTVTGRLVANGSQLIAVINNENRRLDHTR